MDKIWSRLLVIAFVGCVVLHPLVSEAVPALFDHQGRLKDSTGAPLTGTHILTFRLYNVATGGAALWTDPEVVLLNEGVYSVNLPIAPSQFDGAPYWLSVQVDSEPEIAQRVEIVSVPYAARSATTDTAIVGGGWKDLDTAVALADSSEKVGIGTSTPARALHVVVPADELFAGRFESAHPSATITEIKNSSNNITWEVSVAGSDGAFGGLVPSGSMYFYRQGSPIVAAVIDSNGNTGLGDAPVGARLHVEALQGQAGLQLGLNVESNNALGTGIGINVNANGSSTNYAVAAAASGGDLSVAVLGQSFSSADDSYGVKGSASADSVAYGVYGEAQGGDECYGVFGIAENGTNSRYGVWGTASNVDTLVEAIGVRGSADGNGSIGVYGEAGGLNGSIGVYGFGETGIYGQGLGFSARAGIFNGAVDILGGLDVTGSVDVSGTLTKGAGAFRIDHPLDPANKYLQHSFVESPDMKNIYDGVAILDADGRATVTLPAWFEALNNDFRYQLTCVGGYAPVYIASKVSGNQFAIAGGTTGLEVSWQVTGIRKDAFAEANRIQVEVAKDNSERDHYLYPEVRGLDESHSIHSARIKAGLIPAPPKIDRLSTYQQ